MSDAKEYAGLPGRGQRGVAWLSVTRTTSRLWLGEDHLLSVDSTMFQEHYRRFYYRDIHSITIRKTDRRKHWNIGLGMVTAILGLAALGVQSVAASIVLGVLAGIVLLALLINTVLGPTCACQLRTAVQTEELPSLNRLPTAREALAQLRSRIEQAQGSLAHEDVAVRLQAIAGGTAEAPASSGSEPAARPAVMAAPAPPLPYAGNAHKVLAFLFLAETARLGINIFHAHLALTLLSLLSLAAITTFTVIALAQQQNKIVERRLRQWSWASLGYLVLAGAVGTVHYLVITIQYEEAFTDWQILVIFSQISAFDSIWMMASYGLMFAASCALAVTGVAVMRRPAGAAAPPAPPPLPPAPASFQSRDHGNTLPPTLS